jgi:hypothetical protein
MARHCKFDDCWVDGKTFPEFSSWLEKKTLYQAYCKICMKTIELSNMGKRALISHSKGAAHIKRMNAKNSNQPLKAFVIPSYSKEASLVPTGSVQSLFSDENESLENENNSSHANSTSNLTSSATAILRKKTQSCFFSNTSATDAEIYWLLFMLEHRIPMNACKNALSLFQKMFPKDDVPKNMKISPSKAAYSINFGLAPYFEECLLKDMDLSNYYALCFDESFNKIARKEQMDISFRYVDKKTKRTVNRYFTSVFLNQTRASDLLEGIMSNITTITLNKIIQLSMDGPYVNLRLHEMFLNHDEVIALLWIGTCGLHVLHGAVRTSLQKTKWHLNTFLKNLSSFFKNSPKRKRLLLEYSSKNVAPKKYCDTRWLENVPALTAALTILDDVHKMVKDDNTKPPSYNLTYLKTETSKKHLPLSKLFKNILIFLGDPFLKCRLTFFLNISKLFEPFLKKYQDEKPLVPYMNKDITSIARQLIRKILKPNFTKNLDTRRKLNSFLDTIRNTNFCTEYKNDLCSLEKIDVGIELKLMLEDIIKNDPKQEKQALQFRKDIQAIIISILSKISEKSPLKFDLVYNASAILPSNILQYSSETTLEKFDALLTTICSANILKHSEGDLAKCEMETLILKAKDQWKAVFQEFNDNEDRLDTFYLNLLNEDEFPNVIKALEIVFTLSHGNAAVEGGFSVNKSLLVENLSEKSLVSQRKVIDGTKSLGGFNEIEVTPALRNHFTKAHGRYQSFLKTNEGRNKVKSKEAEERKHEQISKLEKEIVALDENYDQRKAELVSKKSKL